jgi:hypothetical protein
VSEQVELLGKTEYANIGELLLHLVAQCPLIDEDIPVKYQSMDSDSCVGIFTYPGAKYLKKNVMGGYTAQIKFQIAYKGYGTSNQNNIDNQALVDSIMDWLENVKELPALPGGIVITKVEALNSAAAAETTGDDNSIVFAADATMEYEAE